MQPQTTTDNSFHLNKYQKQLIIKKIAEAIERDAEIQEALNAAELDPTPSVCELAATAALIVIVANEKGQRVGK